MNPVSACLIVRADPHLAKTVECLRPHVNEICIAHTPCPELYEREVRALCDRYVTVPGSADGVMDWSATRNASFALATQPFCLWADTDDLIDGLEHLPEGLERLNGYPLSRLFCPYEYSRDKETGEPADVLWRERVVRNDGRFIWKQPCHEHLVARDGRYDSPEPRAPNIVWKHQREDKPGESRRDVLKMLRAYESAGNGEDPWLLLNLGLELGRCQDHAQATKYLERYIAVSGWDDEKALAMTQLASEHIAAEGFSGSGYWQNAHEWAAQAMLLRPDWFEPYWIQAQISWLRAVLRGDEDSVKETIEMCRRAREQPLPQHPLAVNMLDRTYKVHEFERLAYETLENWGGALAAVERAIANRPNDGQLRMAKKRYEAALKLEAADLAVTGAATRLDIVFACGVGGEPWNPAVHAAKGIGGSETAVIEMSKRLAKKGHRVRVFCPSGGPGLYDGVEWREGRTITAEYRPTCDVLVAWRIAPTLSWADARTSVLWCHDVVAHQMEPQWALRAQRVLALSDWHKKNLVRAHELAPGNVHVTRNGIDLARFDPIYEAVKGHAGARQVAVTRDPHKAIYSSSGDRGLQVLLDMWPAIRARVPDATLDVFYGLDLWRDIAEQSGDQQKRYSVLSLERRMKYMSALGVTYHGGVNQATLAQAMLGAGAWLFPTWFTETSCIGAMEAQAAGLRIVTSPIAALPETVGDRGHLIAGDWLDERYQSQFINAAVDALCAPDPWRGWTRERIQAHARASYSWDGVADEWEKLFGELLAEADVGVLPYYAGVSEVAA